MTLKFSRLVVLSMFVLSLVLLLDSFLPTVVSTDQVLSFESDWEPRKNGLYYTEGRYSDESMIILTQKHRIPTYASHKYHLEKGDRIKIESTPILGIVTSGFFIDKNINLTPFTGLLDTFWWVPLVIGLTASTGLFFWNNEKQILNFAIVLVILFLIALRIMRIL